MADVIDGVSLARDRGLLLAVRAGGHNVAGHGTVDGGLVLDLRAMNGVWVDPVARTVRVQGGATWGDVDRETQVFGLAVPGGIVSTTGVAGLTLAGGIGWLHRMWGLACDNLLSARVVLASGELVTASAEEHPDLFWAMRGGGGNFGVVVDFTFQAHPVGPEVALAAVFYEQAAGAELMPQWRDLALRAGDEVTTRALYWSMPVSDALPPPVQGKDVLILAALYAGDAEQGQPIIDEFRSLGDPLFDMSDLIPDYRAFQAGFDAAVDRPARLLEIDLPRRADRRGAGVHPRTRPGPPRPRHPHPRPDHGRRHRRRGRRRTPRSVTAAPGSWSASTGRPTTPRTHAGPRLGPRHDRRRPNTRWGEWGLPELLRRRRTDQQVVDQQFGGNLERLHDQEAVRPAEPLPHQQQHHAAPE